MSEAVGGVTNKLLYNTNTVNCQWETRTIGNLCELPLLSVGQPSDNVVRTVNAGGYAKCKIDCASGDLEGEITSSCLEDYF